MTKTLLGLLLGVASPCTRVAVADRVRAQIKSDKDLKQIVASKPTAEFDEQRGKGFLAPDKFVELIWKDLKTRG